MSLVEDWNSKRDEILSKNIWQIVSYAGSGHLKDGNDTSRELREFLSVVSSKELTDYVRQCLEEKPNSEYPFVFQDIVNEAGRRLGFEVESGLYQGEHGRVNNYDGLWKSSDGFTIVVEVKTSTTYTITLEKLVGYIDKLTNGEKVNANKSSVLIVVGRGSTAALEQQIRGSRYAWDIRVINANSLFSLVNIKENLDTPDTEEKILAVLRPQEYTRVDNIIDLVFSVTKDITKDEESDLASQSTFSNSDTPTDSSISATIDAKQTHNHPVQFYEACIKKIEQVKKLNFIRKSRSVWNTSDGNTLFVLLNSREYDTDTKPNYWFALHPSQWERLKSTKDSFLALGCGSADRILLLPKAYIENILPKLGKTERNSYMWWHIVIKNESNKLFLYQNRPNRPEDITKFLLA